VAGTLFNINNSNTQAFIGTASGSTVIPLPQGGTTASAVRASLDDDGDVVGTSDVGGWIYTSGETELLNNLVPIGWNIIAALSISPNNGLILAVGSFNGGTVEYVELTPL